MVHELVLIDNTRELAENSFNSQCITNLCILSNPPNILLIKTRRNAVLDHSTVNFVQHFLQKSQQAVNANTGYLDPGSPMKIA